jgi:UDPglucose 6-dehydrogenase
MLQRNRQSGTLSFSSNLEDGIKDKDYIFIAVGTPMGEDGSADLQFVLSVAKSIGTFMNKPSLVIDKSTVPVGTADKVSAAIASALKLRGVNFDFQVVSNPEFLKEGSAIKDFMAPDRVVIGAATPQALDKMKMLYAPFFRTNDRFVGMDIRSAEMTKYAANAMLATKISFINEMSQICERVGADVNEVRKGIGSDARIGYSFIYPGCGYGGSCFPKDVQALIKTARDHGYEPKVIQAVEDVNDVQKEVLIRKVTDRFGNDLKGKTFGVWGLAFKPETDDMREAPSTKVIKGLVERGAKIIAYDPQAETEAKMHYLKGISEVTYATGKYDATKGVDALLLITEWKEFRSPDFEELKTNMKNPIIFDGRNQYNGFPLKDLGFEYYQIGKK